MPHLRKSTTRKEWGASGLIFIAFAATVAVCALGWGGWVVRASYSSKADIDAAEVIRARPATLVVPDGRGGCERYLFSNQTGAMMSHGSEDCHEREASAGSPGGDPGRLSQINRGFKR